MGLRQDEIDRRRKVIEDNKRRNRVKQQLAELKLPSPWERFYSSNAAKVLTALLGVGGIAMFWYLWPQSDRNPCLERPNTDYWFLENDVKVTWDVNPQSSLVQP